MSEYNTPHDGPWIVDGDTIKGCQQDMYPLLAERIYATGKDLQLMAAAPELLAFLTAADTILRGLDPHGLYASGTGRQFAALIERLS